MKKWKQVLILSSIMHMLAFALFNFQGLVIFTVGFWVGVVSLTILFEDRLEVLK